MSGRYRLGIGPTFFRDALMGLFGERTSFEDIYETAETEDDLPWHREEPWPMLRRLVEERSRAGRALDLGCGAGEFAVYLARHGYDVTGVDRNETAIQMAAARADREGVDLALVEADVLTWTADAAYDLVLDSGCYHGMADADRETYRHRLQDRLAPDGDFVLIHFSKKHFLDWRPVGPRRRSRATVKKEFAPSFVEVDYDEEIQTGVPLPVGPRPLVGQYWFKHASHARET